MFDFSYFSTLVSKTLDLLPEVTNQREMVTDALPLFTIGNLDLFEPFEPVGSRETVVDMIGLLLVMEMPIHIKGRLPFLAMGIASDVMICVDLVFT